MIKPDFTHNPLGEGGIIYQARNKRKSGQVLVPLSLRSRWPLKMDNKDHITKPILAPTAFAQIDLATQNSLPSQWGGRMLTAYITVTQAPSSEMWFLSLWAFFFPSLVSSCFSVQHVAGCDKWWEIKGWRITLIQVLSAHMGAITQGEWHCCGPVRLKAAGEAAGGLWYMAHRSLMCGWELSPASAWLWSTT